MIFIHAADLHLGSPLGGLDAREDLPADTIRQAPMRAFERIAELCEEHGAGLLVLAGDLFDGDADLPTMYRAAAIIERITRGGTKIVSLRGNHDAASRMAGRLPDIDGFTELPTSAPGTVLLPEIGVAVHGRGFEQQHVPDNIVSTYPPAVPDLLNIGVLHTSLTGAVDGHKAYAPATVADLEARGYDYWALGHVHQRSIHGEGSPWIVFAGNPQGRDIGECGERGVTVVEYEHGAIVGTPRAVCTDSVRWHRVEVELGADEDVDELVQRVRGAFAALVDAAPGIGHAVRLVVRGRGVSHAAITRAGSSFRGDVHAAAMSVSVDGLWIERIVVETQPALPDLDELLARDDFVGDAARSLTGGGIARELGDVSDAFAQFDRKVDQLPAHALVVPVAPLEERDLEAARAALLGRLVEQHAAEAEGAL